MAGEKCASDDKQDSSEDCEEETCIFCKIANRDDPSTEILAEVSLSLSTWFLVVCVAYLQRRMR